MAIRRLQIRVSVRAATFYRLAEKLPSEKEIRFPEKEHKMRVLFSISIQLTGDVIPTNTYNATNSGLGFSN